MLKFDTLPFERYLENLEVFFSDLFVILLVILYIDSRSPFSVGLAFNRPKKVKKNLKQINSAAKQKYVEEGQKYADELTKNLGIEEGTILVYVSIFIKLF